MKTLLLILSVALVYQADAQIRLLQQRKVKPDSLVDHRASGPASPRSVPLGVFEELEQLIVNSTVAASPGYFAKQVFVNVSGGESGYYSTNQALSVLQNFLAHRKITSFAFSRFHDSPPTPYATGRLTYIYRGNKESAQVYISLARQESRWVVGQFNIY